MNVRLKQIAQDGASDRDVVTWDNSTGKWVPAPGGLAAVSAKQTTTFFVPLPTGTSDFVPFDATEFESVSSMHDPTVSDSGTATGTQTSTTLQDTTKSWTVNGYANYTVQITGGTGIGQWRRIASNTATTLAVGTAWTTTPNATSTYSITQYSTRLVAPYDGYYHVIARVSGAYQCLVLGPQLFKNGGFVTAYYTHQAKTIEMASELNRIVQLNADDYVEMKIYQGAGSSQSLYASASRLYFQLSRVG